MNRNEQVQLYNVVDQKIMKLSEIKGQDYANTDVLSNFKDVSLAAKSLGLNIHDSTNYALFMTLLKIGRLSNLINNEKTPNNESIDDSFLDGIHYFKLAYSCYKDKK